MGLVVYVRSSSMLRCFTRAVLGRDCRDLDRKSTVNNAALGVGVIECFDEQRYPASRRRAAAFGNMHFSVQ